MAFKKLRYCHYCCNTNMGIKSRPVGSSMIVNSNHETIGSVSGGCIESFVLQRVEK